MPYHGVVSKGCERCRAKKVKVRWQSEPHLARTWTDHKLAVRPEATNMPQVPTDGRGMLLQVFGGGYFP